MPPLPGLNRYDEIEKAKLLVANPLSPWQQVARAFAHGLFDSVFPGVVLLVLAATCYRFGGVEGPWTLAARHIGIVVVFLLLWRTLARHREWVERVDAARTLLKIVAIRDAERGKE